MVGHNFIIKSVEKQIILKYSATTLTSKETISLKKFLSLSRWFRLKTSLSKNPNKEKVD